MNPLEVFQKLLEFVPALTWILLMVPFVYLFYALFHLKQLRGQLRGELAAIGKLKERIQYKGRLEGQGFNESDETILKADETRYVHRLALGAHEGRALPSTSIDALLQPLAEDLSSQLSPWRTLPNLMMLSGLIITLIGLTLTLLELPLQNATAETLTEALPSALQQMGGAFVGSAMGIFLSIVAGFFLSSTARAQQNLLVQLAQLGHRQIAPLVLLPRIEQQVENLQRAISESRVFFQELGQQMKDVSTTFSTQLKDGGDMMRSSLDQLRTSSLEIQQSLSNVTKEMTVAVQQVSGSAQSFGEKMVEGSQYLSKMHDELRNAHTALESMFDRSQEGLNRRAEQHLTQLHEMQAGFGRSASEIMTQIMSNSEQLEGVHAQMVATDRSFSNAGGRIALEVSSAFGGLHDMLSQTLEAHGREMGKVEDSLKAVEREISRSSEQNARLEKVGDEVRELEDARFRNFEEALGQLSTVFERQLSALRLSLSADLEKSHVTFLSQLEVRHGVDVQQAELQKAAFMAELGTLRTVMTQDTQQLVGRLAQFQKHNLERIPTYQEPLIRGLERIEQSLNTHLSELALDSKKQLETQSAKLAAMLEVQTSMVRTVQSAVRPLDTSSESATGSNTTSPMGRPR